MSEHFNFTKTALLAMTKPATAGGDTQQATQPTPKPAKTTEPHFSEFYDAKHEAFFCSEVVKMAAFAASTHEALTAYKEAMACLPKEAETIRKVLGPTDWEDFPTGMAWSLRLAQQKLEEAHDRMEGAFMEVVKLTKTARK